MIILDEDLSINGSEGDSKVLKLTEREEKTECAPSVKKKKHTLGKNSELIEAVCEELNYWKKKNRKKCETTRSVKYYYI